MFNYAITINKNHAILTDYGYSIENDDDIEKLVKQLHMEFPYVHFVIHANQEREADHIHAILSSNYSLEYMKQLKWFHVDIIRNPQAYIKYMYSHDYYNHYILGEMPYMENDDMITYAIINGLVKTVEKYGMLALRNYRNLKDFINDYKDLHQKLK